MHILPNISQSKSNQKMKIGQLIEHNNRNIFFKNHPENKAGRPVPDLFMFFEKALHDTKASGSDLSFNILQ